MVRATASSMHRAQRLITDVDTALDKLNAEGSPAQVAARLEMDCCVGIRRSYTTCPVAEWLLVVTGHRLEIGPELWCTLSESPDEFCYGELPEHVAGFVQGFDRECYPLLDNDKP